MLPQIHHISLLNHDMTKTYPFYHDILGLKLLMKTINQDDHEMYHLFFSDEKGRKGTQLTFFEVLEGANQVFGTNNIERLLLKVPSVEALLFWEKRLEENGFLTYGSETFNHRPILRFDAPDNTQIGLVPLRDFENPADFSPCEAPHIPKEFAILGIDALQLRVQYAAATTKELRLLFDWQQKMSTTFFTTGQDVTILANDNPDFYQEVHVIQDRKAPLAELGIGGIQHVAFGVADEEELFLKSKVLDERSFHNSGILPREFFTSLYFREPNRLLFEIATNSGSLLPIAYENQSANFHEVPLYLPEFLEPDRTTIEEILNQQKKPL